MLPISALGLSGTLNPVDIAIRSRAFCRLFGEAEPRNEKLEVMQKSGDSVLLRTAHQEFLFQVVAHV